MPKKPYKLDKVAIRMVKKPPLYSEKPMNCAEAAIELMQDVLREYDREVLCVVTRMHSGFLSAGRRRLLQRRERSWHALT